MKTMHLFAGAGGGLLSDLILGHTPVCAVEWDAYCCQVLCVAYFVKRWRCPHCRERLVR